MKRELTCIVCPRGCALTVELEGNTVQSVIGHSCKRGEAYAKSECECPVRTLTTTVCVDGGGVLPVKTDRPVPKDLLFDCMKEINRIVAPADTKLGDVLLANILGTGANVIAVKTL